VRYIQLVEFDSRHPAQEIRQALDDWLAPCAGSARCRWRSSLRITSARITTGSCWGSRRRRRKANRRSELAETKAAYDRWASLLDGEPAFHNLDVVEHVEG
jgi:hypothetical protein